MIPWNTIVSVLVAFASWVSGLITAGLPVLGGALSALLGVYGGAILESQRQRNKILQEDICRPMMNELEDVTNGEFPSESAWNDIDTVSKQLLDDSVQQNIQNYIDTLEELSELNNKISNFETQVASRLPSDGAVITGDSQANISVKVEEVSHPQDPDEFRFAEVDLSEFIRELPDINEIYSEGHDPSEQVPDNLRKWAESDECEYNNLIYTWDSASSDWESEFRRLFRVPIQRYQENIQSKNKKESQLRETASTIFSNLKEVLDRQYNIRHRLLSVIF